MEFKLLSKTAQTNNGDLLVVPYLDGQLFKDPFINSALSHLQAKIKGLIKKTQFKGEVGQKKLITLDGKPNYVYLLIVGLGKSEELNLEKLRKSSAMVAKMAKSMHLSKIHSGLSLLKSKQFTTEQLAQALVEGALLGTYEFSRYKSKSKNDKSKKTALSLGLFADTKSQKSAKTGMQLGKIYSAATATSRDLGNTPALDLPPLELANAAKKIKGIKTKIFKVTDLKRLKMNGILSVGQGSKNPPALVELHYKPTGKTKKKLAIVGKGIVFDSGGLSLKPPKGMEEMKLDMCGAANVVGIFEALAQLKPQIEVFGYIAAAENMPSGDAIRPGDVYKAYNGKTVEILNTDAEGRLVLGDALSYAAEKKPDYIIDMATLTGACLVALGDQYAGLFSNDDKLASLLKEASSNTGEKIWELPLAEEYKSSLKSPIADLKNIGGSYGGSITAALFLQNFIGKAKWAHLDIAGPAMSSKNQGYINQGGTGFGVRTLIQFIRDLS